MKEKNPEGYELDRHLLQEEGFFESALYTGLKTLVSVKLREPQQTEPKPTEQPEPKEGEKYD